MKKLFQHLVKMPRLFPVGMAGLIILISLAVIQTRASDPESDPEYQEASRPAQEDSQLREGLDRAIWEDSLDTPVLKRDPYDPEGRKDPFRPFWPVESARKDQKSLHPLQQREIQELELVGIIWGRLGQIALLRTPDGKGHHVKVGTRVGLYEGVVQQITRREVFIVEHTRDVMGVVKQREVVMKLKPGHHG